MAHDVRLWFAVHGTRTRMCTGMPPEQAAERLAYMVDVPAKQVLRLAVDAERGCAEARHALELRLHDVLSQPFVSPPLHEGGR